MNTKKDLSAKCAHHLLNAGGHLTVPLEQFVAPEIRRLVEGPLLKEIAELESLLRDSDEEKALLLRELAELVKKNELLFLQLAAREPAP